MKKSFLKFVAGGLGLIAIAVGILFLVNYIRYRVSPEYRTEQALKELERRYAEDTYGGDTPEETLQLFIDALKKGDIELASKYFVVDEQEQWRQNLRKLEGKKLLNDMIGDLGRSKERSDISNEMVSFYIYNDNNQLAVSIKVGQGSNGLWKILGL